MKKITLPIITFLPLVTLLYAQPQEVQEVIDITPDKPADMMMPESKPLALPMPPIEIKAVDVKTQDLNMTPTAKHKATKAKKLFNQLSQEEQIVDLKRRIDKLRKKSHETRDKIHALEVEMARLQQEVKDLKENNRNSNKTQGE